MQTLPLPINFGANKDIEEVLLLESLSAAAVNVFFDTAGNVVPRPGIVSFCDLGSGSLAGVRGLFWWDYYQVFLAVYDGDLYRISTAGVATKITVSALFEEFGYVSWAEFGDTVYAANGGEIIKITYSAAAVMADGDAPTEVSGVAAMDGYLLAHDNDGMHVFYSDAGDPDSWSGEWISPSDAIGGEIRFIGVANNILEIVGTKGWEGWRNDGDTPFVKDEQYTVERGAASLNVFALIEDRWYFVDNKRRVMRLSGRTPENLSSSLDKVVGYYEGTTVSGPVGKELIVDMRPMYSVYIPQGNRTCVFDIRGEKWTDFKYSTVAGSYNSIPITSSAWCPILGSFFIGISGSGVIGYFSSDTFTDYGGEDVAPYIRTTHVHYDRPDLSKKSYRLDFYLKKTTSATSASTASLTVKWRDDGSTNWKTTRTVTLEAISNTDFRGSITRLGMYKTRQYQINLPTDAPLALVNVMETFHAVGVEDG